MSERKSVKRNRRSHVLRKSPNEFGKRISAFSKTKTEYDPLKDISNVFIADEPPPEPPDLHDIPPRKDYVIYPRAEWNARPPLDGIEDVVLPAKIVIYTAIYEGYTPACRNKQECVKAMQLVQSVFMDEKNQPDIPYNFVVAGDGNVYEGRGWNKKPEMSVKHEEYKNNTIDIGMITHYVNEPLNKRSKKESEVLEILIQFIQDHTDDKHIASECNLEGYTGKRKY